MRSCLAVLILGILLAPRPLPAQGVECFVRYDDGSPFTSGRIVASREGALLDHGRIDPITGSTRLEKATPPCDLVFAGLGPGAWVGRLEASRGTIVIPRQGFRALDVIVKPSPLPGQLRFQCRMPESETPAFRALVPGVTGEGVVGLRYVPRADTREHLPRKILRRVFRGLRPGMAIPVWTVGDQRLILPVPSAERTIVLGLPRGYEPVDRLDHQDRPDGWFDLAAVSEGEDLALYRGPVTTGQVIVASTGRPLPRCRIEFFPIGPSMSSGPQHRGSIPGVGSRVGKRATVKTVIRTDAAGRFAAMMRRELPRDSSGILIVTSRFGMRDMIPLEKMVLRDQDLGTLALHPPRTVPLRVVDEYRKPRQGVQVWVKRTADEGRYVTDEAGLVSLPVHHGLRDQPLVFWTRSRNWIERSWPDHLDGETEFVLKRGLSVNITLRPPAVHRGHSYFVVVQGRGCSMGGSVHEEAGGWRCSFENLPPDVPLLISVLSGQAKVATREVVLRASEAAPRDLVIELDRQPVVNAEVRDSAGEPLDGVTVLARELGDPLQSDDVARLLAGEAVSDLVHLANARTIRLLRAGTGEYRRRLAHPPPDSLGLMIYALHPDHGMASQSITGSELLRDTTMKLSLREAGWLKVSLHDGDGHPLKGLVHVRLEGPGSESLEIAGQAGAGVRIPRASSSRRLTVLYSGGERVLELPAGVDAVKVTFDTPGRVVFEAEPGASRPGYLWARRAGTVAPPIALDVNAATPLQPGTYRLFSDDQAQKPLDVEFTVQSAVTSKLKLP